MLAIMSFTYFFYVVICVDNFVITFLSRSTMKIPAITSPKGDPIATIFLSMQLIIIRTMYDFGTKQQ